jgi:hypothetical protein
MVAFGSAIIRIRRESEPSGCRVLESGREKSEMIDRYVVSKLWRKRIGCDGPLTAQVQRLKLENEMEAAGEQPDVNIEYLTPRPRAVRSGGRNRKRGTKQRYK